MVIEDSIIIQSSIEKVWNIFADLSCWEDWCLVLQDVCTEGTGHVETGKQFRFCIRSFVFPLKMKPVIEEVIPNQRIVWSGKKFGIHARHEFILECVHDSVRLTSRETFRGFFAFILRFLFVKKRLSSLTASFLKELKAAAEK
jgi:hypothetical protein